MFSFQLCYVHYTMLQVKNSTRNISAINQVAMESTDNKHNIQHIHKEATSCYHESTPCVVSEKDWNTKENKDKSMMHVLYVLQLAKMHILG